MRVYDVRNLIDQSVVDDWEYVQTETTIFRQQVVTSGGSGEGTQIETREHYSIAVYQEDVSLTLAWGLDYRGGESWEESAWKHAFPDPKVYGYFADVQWNGVVIERHLLLSVDGGRYVLPSGRPQTKQSVGADWPTLIGYTASPHEAHVARLVHSLPGAREDFDAGLRRAKITVQ